MRQAQPVLTVESIERDLRALGVALGQTLLVHASLRSIGPVVGGAETVVRALRSVLGAEGTLVVPTETPGNSDTSRVHLGEIAGLTAEEVGRFRSAMPPFDPATSPSQGMGRIAEHVRTTPNAVRSAHPQTSFAAPGPLAGKLMQGHATNCHHGEDSPLARMYEVGASILLLGVDYEACAAIHLAEYRYMPDPPRRSYRCVVMLDGRPRWWEYEDVILDDRDLKPIGVALDGHPEIVTSGMVGAAACRLMPLTDTVDFSQEWMSLHRGPKIGKNLDPYPSGMLAGSI